MSCPRGNVSSLLFHLSSFFFLFFIFINDRTEIKNNGYILLFISINDEIYLFFLWLEITYAIPRMDTTGACPF